MSARSGKLGGIKNRGIDLCYYRNKYNQQIIEIKKNFEQRLLVNQQSYEHTPITINVLHARTYKSVNTGIFFISFVAKFVMPMLVFTFNKKHENVKFVNACGCK